MVFVKIRETYDLHTQRNKMTVIGVHTPNSDIVKRNYPGLLVQCRAYRPISCDIKIACASILPLDPQGVGTVEGAVAPEDVFNPILYKPMSNFGMSQIDLYINKGHAGPASGDSVDASVGGIDDTDDFDIYYGLLSQTNEWRHANPQSGLSMTGLKPLVYETYQTLGDNAYNGADTINWLNKDNDGKPLTAHSFRGASKLLPLLNTTGISSATSQVGDRVGFDLGSGNNIGNVMSIVPAPKIYVAGILVPPSRLHELFFRMVVEWTLEFTMIRPLGEVTNWTQLKLLGVSTHHINYDYTVSNSKTMLVESTDMVDTTEDSDIKKVM